MTNRDKLNKILIDYNKSYLSDVQIEKIFKSEYNQLAIEFLLESDTQIDIKPTGLRFSNWNTDTEVNSYKVTLKNKKHSYSYEFFDSIHNTEKNISAKYDFYSVLACIDSYTEQNFDDFCLVFGYEFKNESEYIKTKTVHLACLDQAKNLRKLFNHEQLEKLSEIK